MSLLAELAAFVPILAMTIQLLRSKNLKNVQIAGLTLQPSVLITDSYGWQRSPEH
jgi:hypothetical protein